MTCPIEIPPSFSRRAFHGAAAAGTAAAAIATRRSQADSPRSAGPPQGQAEHCILIWLGGGMCHVDTFDPKVVGDPLKNKAGSAYPSIATAVADVRICEHLRQTAGVLDRGVLIRSLHHPLKVDHADSTNLMKTGRLTSGTVIYPSLGSLVSHQRGPTEKGIPPYLVMGYPNVTRGPGFLGTRYGYLYLTDVQAGPTGLQAARDVPPQRQRHRNALLDVLRRGVRARAKGDATLKAYDASIEEARSLMSGRFAGVFDLDREQASTRERYGSSFGQRCLLARRLVTAGVRFVEVAYDLNFKNGTGWDTHRHGQERQHELIQDLDRSLSTLVQDLDQRRLLDRTLVVVATEFGRPAEFDGQGGRGHQSAAFSVALFGGGLKTGQVVGSTDDMGAKIVERPVGVPDLHATILCTLGIDPTRELYDGDRPIPITNHGQPLVDLFA